MSESAEVFFEGLEDRLRGFRGLRWRREGNRLEIDPPNEDGFPIDVDFQNDRIIVDFGGCRRRFGSQARQPLALQYVSLGLSKDCRLTVCSRGGVDCKWTVEAYTECGWGTEWDAAILFYPFWRRAVVRVLQNRPGDGPA